VEREREVVERGLRGPGAESGGDGEGREDDEARDEKGAGYV